MTTALTLIGLWILASVISGLLIGRGCNALRRETVAPAAATWSPGAEQDAWPGASGIARSPQFEPQPTPRPAATLLHQKAKISDASAFLPGPN